METFLSVYIFQNVYFEPTQPRAISAVGILKNDYTNTIISLNRPEPRSEFRGRSAAKSEFSQHFTPVKSDENHRRECSGFYPLSCIINSPVCKVPISYTCTTPD